MYRCICLVNFCIGSRWYASQCTRFRGTRATSVFATEGQDNFFFFFEFFWIYFLVDAFVKNVRARAMTARRNRRASLKIHIPDVWERREKRPRVVYKESRCLVDWRRGPSGLVKTSLNRYPSHQWNLPVPRPITRKLPPLWTLPTDMTKKNRSADYWSTFFSFGPQR